LDAWRSLLESGAKIPDVYAVDVIWPEILAENLLDLKAFVPAPEIAMHFPELIANNTVNGKLIALPCLVDVGSLFYRTDLLRHYGFRTPPRTWEELETMAARIQAGERARGQKGGLNLSNPSSQTRSPVLVTGSAGPITSSPPSPSPSVHVQAPQSI
jgi:ABC-type glycerol-3-phosphate transport system substrate-binding protein